MCRQVLQRLVDNNSEKVMYRVSSRFYCQQQLEKYFSNWKLVSSDISCMKMYISLKLFFIELFAAKRIQKLNQNLKKLNAFNKCTLGCNVVCITLASFETVFHWQPVTVGYYTTISCCSYYCWYKLNGCFYIIYSSSTKRSKH